MNSLLMVMKKTVGSKKEKIVESESEVKVPVSIAKGLASGNFCLLGSLYSF